MALQGIVEGRSSTWCIEEDGGDNTTKFEISETGGKRFEVDASRWSRHDSYSLRLGGHEKRTKPSPADAHTGKPAEAEAKDKFPCSLV